MFEATFINPRPGYCVIRRTAGPASSVGGIAIPEAYRDNQGKPGPMADNRGEVLAVGLPCERDDKWVEADFAPGAHVIFGWFQIHPLKDVFVVKIDDVLAVVDPGQHQ